jgi:hypothetical protein
MEIENGCLTLLENALILSAAGWGIVNNFVNCADIQISIELELKILEQINHLNL